MALLEFTFVAILLLTLLFGIIGFGVALSFKQTVTQAANEAARAAAVTADDPLTGGTDEREQAAELTIASFEAWGRDCTAAGMTCRTEVHDCGGPTTVDQPGVFPDCITVRLTYDYSGHPILPSLPLVSSAMPDTIETTATAQLTFPSS